MDSLGFSWTRSSHQKSDSLMAMNGLNWQLLRLGR